MTNKSTHISRHGAENLLHGFDYAKCAGYPLNTQVVIVLRDRLDACADTLFKRILRKYRGWFRRVQIRYGRIPIPPLHTNTKESPEGHTHVNWTLHIPEYLREEFERKLLQWVGKVQEVQASDVFVAKIAKDTEKNVANYMIKGIDPTYIDYLHLQRIAANQGEYHGRRSSVSVAISRGARKDAGFRAKYNRNDWKKGIKWELAS